MPINIVDIVLLQMQQHVQSYDVSTMEGRRWSTEKLTQLFIAVQKDLPVSVCLEIGAHEASFSQRIKKASPHLQVFAYEANPHVHAKYKKCEELSKLDISYEHRAIGNEDGTIALHIASSIDGKCEPVDGKRHSLLSRYQGSEDNTIDVPCSRLDTLFGKASTYATDIFSLWIDAEGATALILKGAEDVLLRTASIFVEMESIPKFEGQWLEAELTAYLMERDFLPLSRDFAFHHQYNMLFVKKNYLSQVEFQYQRFLSDAMYGKIIWHAQGMDKIQIQNARYSKVVAPEKIISFSLPERIDTMAELQSAMDMLPLLRAERDYFDPHKSVVVCHTTDLAEAIDWYRNRLPSLPTFYVKGDIDTNIQGVQVRDFTSLTPDMDVQLYCKQAAGPGLCHFAHLAVWLHAQGFSRYHIESHSMEKLYARNKQWQLTENDYAIMFALYNRLHDKASRYTYLAVCKSRQKGQPGYIPMAAYEQYYHPLVQVKQGDDLCEGGVDNGATTKGFAQIVGAHGMVYAFEPVPENYQKSAKYLLGNKNVCLEELALWKQSGPLGLDVDTPSLSSAFAHENVSDSSQCMAVSIDDYFASKRPPNCIKLDVEGAELPVLQGAQKTLLAHKPKLLISIYHERSGSDFIQVPKFLMDLPMDYDFYVGHHRPWYNETILYGIPKK